MNQLKYVNTILLVASIIVSLLMGEALARLLKIEDNLNKHRTNSDSVSLREQSEEFHHNFIPGTKATVHPDLEELSPFPFEVNSQGVRGPEIRKKPINGFRVLILGDSFIEAHLVKFENTIGQVLENRIAHRSVDVIQHGVSSWSPLLELNWYLKVGRQYEPDVIILFLCMNDFYSKEAYIHSDAAYQKACVKDGNGFPIKFVEKNSEKASGKKTGNVEQNRFSNILRDKSKFFLWIYTHWDRLTEEKLNQSELDHLLSAPLNRLEPMMDRMFENTREEEIKKELIRLSRSYKLWDKRNRKTVEDVLANIKKLNNVVEKEGAELIVTFIPLGWNFKDENIGGKITYQFARNMSIPMGGIEQKCKEWAKRNNIEYLDLFGEIARYKKKYSDKLYFYHDGHWNDTGQKVIARILHETLRQRLSG